MARKHSRRGNKHSIKRAHRRSSRVKRQAGGYGPGAGPVGAPWQADPNTWPGMAALDGADTQGIAYGNHLPLSPNGIAVGGVMPAEPEVKFSGGARRKSRKHYGKKRSGRKSRATRRHGKKGKRMSRRMRGGFGPQDLINGIRWGGHSISNMYNNFMGNQHSANPSPLDQPINSLDFPENIVAPNPANLRRSFDLAGQTAAPL